MLDITWQEAYLILILNRNTILFQLTRPSLSKGVVLIKSFEKLEVKKATGLDNLLPRFLKIEADILAPSQTFEFSQSISSGTVLVKWKLATVTPVFKKGARKDVNSYRPISILPAVVKIFERMIYNQLYSYLNDSSRSANCQYGFRLLHSILTALAYLRPKTVGLLT